MVVVEVVTSGNTGRGWSWLRSDRFRGSWLRSERGSRLSRRRRRRGEERRGEERRGGEEDEEERRRRRTRQEEATDIKSNNPHLAGGEI